MTQGVTVSWLEEQLREFANIHPQLNIDSSAARLMLAQYLFHNLAHNMANMAREHMAQSLEERGGDYT